MIHVYMHIDLDLHNSSRKHALNCIIHCKAGKPDSVVLILLGRFETGPIAV